MTPFIDYETKKTVPRIGGLSRAMWLLCASLCVLIEFADWFATDGRIRGWDDVVFIVVYAVLGIVAIVNALRLTRRAG